MIVCRRNENAWDPLLCWLRVVGETFFDKLHPKLPGDAAVGMETVALDFGLISAGFSPFRCVFVDAGVSALDLERKRAKEEQKAHARAVVEQGELALLTVDAPKAPSTDRVALRPPMLQVELRSTSLFTSRCDLTG